MPLLPTVAAARLWNLAKRCGRSKPPRERARSNAASSRIAADRQIGVRMRFGPSHPSATGPRQVGPSHCRPLRLGNQAVHRFGHSKLAENPMSVAAAAGRSGRCADTVVLTTSGRREAKQASQKPDPCDHKPSRRRLRCGGYGSSMRQCESAGDFGAGLGPPAQAEEALIKRRIVKMYVKLAAVPKVESLIAVMSQVTDPFCNRPKSCRLPCVAPATTPSKPGLG